MAQIANTNLTITANLPAKTARVVVTGQLRFSQLEMFNMQHGLRFKLDCKMWGEDNGQNAWIDPDDHLFTYGSKFYPDANPAQTESFVFDTTVPMSRLNEDSSTDEIYGELILKNLETGATAKKRTNVIHHQFG